MLCSGIVPNVVIDTYFEYQHDKHIATTFEV